MIFASKTPRDLNHDPEPFVDDHWCRWIAPVTFQPRTFRYDPRPEFDHVQHNEPNPILVAIRQSDLDVSEWRAAIISTEIYGGLRAWEDPTHRFHVLTKATDEQLDHADRVLTRLQGLS